MSEAIYIALIGALASILAAILPKIIEFSSMAKPKGRGGKPVPREGIPPISWRWALGGLIVGLFFGVLLFTFFSPLEPPPVSVSNLENELKAVNIELSGDPRTLPGMRNILKTSPTYQELARLCLKLLDKERLRNLIDLDTVYPNYLEVKKIPQNSEKVSDFNDLEALKEAIVIRWNNRWWEEGRISSFDEAVEPR